MFDSLEEYEKFLRENVLFMDEVKEILGYTKKSGRQTINYHVKKGNLRSLKTTSNMTIFSKREVERFKKERDG